MANLKSTVKIVEVCKVASPPASATTPNSFPLTFFDILWLRLSPVQRLFFYEFPTQHTNTTAFFYSNILPTLKHSLSLALQHFLPLSGNLTWPQSSPIPVINYVQGDAVSLTVAESNGDFHHLSSHVELIEATAYHALVPDLAVSHERAAVLALQVTLFQNRGFSIGISTHHAVVDGKTSVSFMKSWAHMCSSRESSTQLPVELQPVYDRNVIKDPTGLGELYAKQWQDLDDGPNNRSLTSSSSSKEIPSDSVRRSFQLTRANIEKVRHLVKLDLDQMAKAKGVHDDHHDQVHISTFSLTCAYVWVCSVKAEEINDEKIHLVFAVDCRPRLEPPVPTNYFGNCVGGKSVITETKGVLGKDGLAVAVKAIGEAIKSLETTGIFNGAENWALNVIRATKSETSSTNGKCRIYALAGSPRFEVYGSDFGWGRPRKVDVVSIDRTGAFSFSDSRDGDGVEIGLVLKKRHMEAFASLFAQGL